MPAAVAIDLSRLPSHGREVGVALRGNKKTRHIPLVFVGGEPEKVDKVRQSLPDAVFTGPAGLPAALESACVPADPVVPAGPMERYEAKTAAEKLGIRAGSGVGVVDPPRDYLTALGALPGEVDFVEDPENPLDVTLWFVHDPAGLMEALRPMRAMANKTKLWIVWRKAAGNGVTQYAIREAAATAGLVDYKICALDSRWSGMLFTRKKA